MEHNSDENWDTRETRLHMNNKELLHSEALAYARRPQTLEDASQGLKAIFDWLPAQIGVEPARVQWERIAAFYRDVVQRDPRRTR